MFYLQTLLCSSHNIIIEDKISASKKRHLHNTLYSQYLFYIYNKAALIKRFNSAL